MFAGMFGRSTGSEFGAAGLLVIPEELEGFLQVVVGPHNRSVEANQVGQTLLLVGREIPGVLQ